jgi:hypothetical protein
LREDEVVLIKPRDARALFRKEAHDLHRHAAEPHFLAHRRFLAEEHLCRDLSDHTDQRAALHVLFREDGSFGQLAPVADREILLRRPLDHPRGVVLVAVHELPAAIDARRDPLHAGAFLANRLGIIWRERHAPAAAGTHARLHRVARINLQHVRAELRDALLQFVRSPLPDLDHRDDGGDANDDAQTREGRPHQIAAQAAEGGLQRLMHEQKTASALGFRLSAFGNAYPESRMPNAEHRFYCLVNL